MTAPRIISAAEVERAAAHKRSKADAVKPIVMYQGGKARFAKKILDHLCVRDDEIYIEPFVGMGAVYLALRARGWKGQAILNDANPAIAAVWRCLHSAELGEALALALEKRDAWPRTNAEHKRRAALSPPSHTVDMAADWIWLQEGSFSGRPVGLVGGKYTTHGCAFDHDKAGREAGDFRRATHSVRQIADKVRKACRVLASLPCEVSCESARGLPSLNGCWYLDPPYVGTTSYDVEAAPFTWDWAASLPGRVFVSEQKAPSGWGFELLGGRAGEMTGTSRNTLKTEYLFTPPGQT